MPDHQRLLQIAPAVLLLGFAPAPLPKPSKLTTANELKKLQGTWVVVRRAVGGSEVQSRNMTAVITGDRIKFLLEGEVRTEWGIILDVTKSPKVFDRKRVGGVVKEGSGMLRGIYHLEGDTLTLCYLAERDGPDRPASFEGTRRGQWLSVFERKKP